MLGTLARFALPAVVTVASVMPALSEAQQSVRIGIGTQVINLTYPWLTAPVSLGYWQDMGLEVEIIPIGGSLQAVQMLEAGSIDFAQLNASALIQANLEQGLDLRIVTANTVNSWSVVTLAGSAITEPADLAGKRVGVLSLASSGVPLIRSYLADVGVDPDDVAMIATGAGAPALLALQNGSVDALAFWGSMNVTFENMGADLTRFYAEEWRQMPDFSLATSARYASEHPDIVESIGRGVVMGSLFAVTSPDCARRLHWAHHPETVPTGAPDEATAIEWDMRALADQIATMEAVRLAADSPLWGAVTTEGLDRVQDFLVSTQQITAAGDSSTFFLSQSGFFETINDIDADAVIAQATACEIGE